VYCNRHIISHLSFYWTFWLQCILCLCVKKFFCNSVWDISLKSRSQYWVRNFKLSSKNDHCHISFVIYLKTFVQLCGLYNVEWDNNYEWRIRKKGVIVCEISSSHGGEYDVQSCLLGCTASLMMEAVRTSETSVDNHFTRHSLSNWAHVRQQWTVWSYVEVSLPEHATS
jgi:hypothetical protein